MDLERNTSGTAIWTFEMRSNLMRELLSSSIASTSYSTPI
jgi:hypothetical protein